MTLPPQVRTTSPVLRAILLPVLLSGAMEVCCYWAAGLTLGLFFSAFIIVTVAAPLLLVREKSLWLRVLSIGGAVDGGAVVWFVAVIHGQISLWQWLECYVVLIAFAAAILAVTELILRCGAGETLASAVGTVLALVWLSWPVWLAQVLPVRPFFATWLVRFSPLFAVNAIVKQLGIWTERPLAYRLTNLNQDVPYSLPEHPMLCALGQLLCALALLWLTVKWRSKWRGEVDAP